jgi:hypothetical protein
MESAAWNKPDKMHEEVSAGTSSGKLNKKRIFSAPQQNLE